MKRLLCFALLLLPLVSQAAETAYTALRVVAKKNGDASLGRVVGVHGRGGSPEPQVWKVVLLDPGSRGGVHEFEVQKGPITGERSPTHGAGGAPLDLNKLNIDSEGAFTIVNQEAQKTNLPFDRVDYFLSNTGHGAPVWHLELFDAKKGRVASMDIAADSGNVLSRNLQPGPGVQQDDRAFLREQTERDRRAQAGGPPPVYDDDRRPDDARYDERRYDDRHRGDEELGPGIFDIFGKISRHFEKRSAQLKSFFGGH